MKVSNYIVRQYRPNYFSGFRNEIVSGVAYDQIAEVPFCQNFKRPNFDRFTVSPYREDELIIEAHYTDGEHWVVGFAIPEDSKLREDWRYQEEERQ